MAKKTSKGNYFLDPSSQSSRLYQKAKKYMPGGNSRTTVFFTPHPFYAVRGQGCIITDADGVERIDFHNNYTSLIHGHADPDVVKAISKALPLGTAFGAPTESEIELAKLITERIPSVEQVRFANSGSEAVLMTIRAARAYTGRDKIAKFEGAYHGCYDYMEVSVASSPKEMGRATSPIPVPDSEGITSGVLQDVVLMPFNNIEIVESIIKKNRNTLAAVIADPLPSRAGLVPPQKGFFKSLREITKKYGMLLICDEVKSFRLSYGGGQELFGMEPDITALGKFIGGGFPAGAVGGLAEVMQVFDPSKGHPRVPHAGTFNANPMTMIAGRVTLEKFNRPAVKRLNTMGESLIKNLNQLFAKSKIKAQVTGAGSLFLIHLTSKPLTDYRSSFPDALQKEMMSRLFFKLLEAGIFLASEGMGALSTPMTSKEIDTFLAAMESSMAAMVKEYPQLKR